MAWWKWGEDERPLETPKEPAEFSAGLVPGVDPAGGLQVDQRNRTRPGSDDIDSLLNMFEVRERGNGVPHSSPVEHAVIDPAGTEPGVTDPTEHDLIEPAVEQTPPSTTNPWAPTTEENGAFMADHQTSLNEAMQIDGALGAALVETATGMALGMAGNPPINLEVAAAGNSSVVQAKLRTMRDLGLEEKLEDILITLESQYHVIRTLGSENGLFVYLVLDKERANLALARFKLAKIERELEL